MSFINYYKDRGHVFGECWSKADSELMYVNIPKNATSWTKPNLQDWGWEIFNYHTDNLNKTAMVVLRDPVDRWLSGIAEYMFLYHKDKSDQLGSNPAFFDIIFGKVAFDDHTEKQVYFIEGLDLSNCVFFEFGKTYRKNFSAFLAQNGMPNRYETYDHQHVTSDSKERSYFKRLFNNELKNNPKYLHHLIQYFKQDYELINSVEFYGTR